MDKKALQELYLTHLKEEGYKSELDNDGDIRFKYEGANCYISIDERDENYFNMILPNFWKIEADRERANAIFAANSINCVYKCGKILLRGKEEEYMQAEIGLFFNDPNDFKFFFARAVQILKGMAHDFQKAMNEIG